MMIHRILTTCALSLLAAGALHCGPADAEVDQPEDDGEHTEGVNAAGTAQVGQSCLNAPVLKKDGCAPELVCNAQGAAPGVCHAVSSEAGECDPAFGDLDCQAGLSCAAKPGGGGVCQGAGVGPCYAENLGFDCAAGWSCVMPAGPGVVGACTPNGSEGTGCDGSLIDGGCLDAFACVVPRDREESEAVCTDPESGGLGAACGKSNPSGPKCASAYICAPAGPGPGSYLKWRCRLPGEVGEWCAAFGCASDLNCFGGLVDASGIVKEGKCDEPADLWEYCGSQGVNNCGYSGTTKLGCVNHKCVTLKKYGESCTSTSSCQYPYKCTACTGAWCAGKAKVCK